MSLLTRVREQISAGFEALEQEAFPGFPGTVTAPGNNQPSEMKSFSRNSRLSRLGTSDLGNRDCLSAHEAPSHTGEGCARESLIQRTGNTGTPGNGLKLWGKSVPGSDGQSGKFRAKPGNLPLQAADTAALSIPAAWADPLRAALARALPDMPHGRWSQFLKDAPRLSADWGDQALALGWGARDFFGFHPAAPWHRIDCLGLAYLLNGKKVLAITGSTARLSGEQTFYRFPGGDHAA